MQWGATVKTFDPSDPSPPSIRAEGASKRAATVEGRSVTVESHQDGARYLARVLSGNPAGVIGRAQGASRDEAEAQALEGARTTLRLRQSSREMKRVIEKMPDSRTRK